jgi:hypothetical protein
VLQVKNFTYLFILPLLLSASLSANCDLVKDRTYDSYQEFKEAESLHNDKKYSDAYTMLLKSLSTYPTTRKEISLNYSCVTYIPGPYAPIIKRYQKSETFDFDRTTLGVAIKHQLSPAPYVFIEYQKNKTIVSAINSTRTSRHSIEKRLPLENFSVTIGGSTFSFGNLEVGKLTTRKKNRSLSQTDSITTAEDFGFKLYK